MSDETVSPLLVEYLGRYTTFAVSSRDIAVSGSRRPAARAWAAPGSPVRGLGGAVLALALAAALIVVLGVGLGLRARTQATQPVAPTLFGGPPARAVPNPRDNFVWFVGTLQYRWRAVPAQEGGPEPASGTTVVVTAVGVKVAVLDWTGAVRYRFTIGRSRLDPAVFPGIESISADGTRALLNDGSVINQTGAVVGRIAALANAVGTPRWTSDSQAVCAGADSGGRLSLRIYSLDGTSRLIASVPDPLGATPGEAPSPSVLSCDPGTDIAVLARYRFVPLSVEQCQSAEHACVNIAVDPVAAGIWAIRMSSGTVTLHEPDAAVATGEPFFYGSENGALAAEFLWSSSAKDNQLDRVLRIASGSVVPGLPDTGTPNLPAVSADGTLVLATVENPARTQLTVDLINASGGHIIRSVTIEGTRLSPAYAAAYPGGSSFMIDVDGELALLDSNGGISRLTTTLNLDAAPGDSGYQGMSQAQR